MGQGTYTDGKELSKIFQKLCIFNFRSSSVNLSKYINRKETKRKYTCSMSAYSTS